MTESRGKEEDTVVGCREMDVSLEDALLPIGADPLGRKYPGHLLLYFWRSHYHLKKQYIKAQWRICFP